MKTIIFTALLLLCYSCTENEDVPTTPSTTPPATPSPGKVTISTDNSGTFDVLGLGYDITEEYMGENSTRSKVIDVATFKQDNPGRFDNPFVGVFDQKVYTGKDYNSFLNDLLINSKFAGSTASMGMGEEAVEAGFFSGNLGTGFNSEKEYSYSSKYSFARAEVFKKQRKYYLNTDVETLQNYLSSEFLEDLGRLPADEIVKMYGTHVLTNATVGGKYIAYYKSEVVNTNSESEKETIVKAGVNYILSQIGVGLYGILNKDEITKLNTNNSNWECHIKSIGGSTSKELIVEMPDQEPPFIVQYGEWTKSVDDELSRLVDVNWDATYPIYDLISNPAKKQEIKEAVLKYIASKKAEASES